MTAPLALPALTAGVLSLRPLDPADRVAVRAMLEEPEVARWWHPDPTEPERDVFSPDPGESIWTIEHGGEFAGVLTVGEETSAHYRHVSLDIALPGSVQGRGIGPEALRLGIGWLLGTGGHHRVTIDPACENARAIRAYEKVGFTPVGVMHAYELGLDGRWHDNLLMDLVRLAD